MSQDVEPDRRTKRTETGNHHVLQLSLLHWGKLLAISKVTIGYLLGVVVERVLSSRQGANSIQFMSNSKKKRLEEDWCAMDRCRKLNSRGSGEVALPLSLCETWS